ncbi:MAG: sigma-54-dependent Fis family transcriptional regulator [Kofleriaceae bacterium]|nr:sigma-54-dependent Fis family transcriptional regulator [Kofleriaceae bacterium]MCL4228739.1 sigma-54 dependent transcriptional regulator [Myxococcales bacterium]
MKDDADVIAVTLEGLLAEFADPLMREVHAELCLVGRTLMPVLLQGETGTGKEVGARVVHAVSARHGGPFVAVNCAALPTPLMESELFGHERGAFTGAVSPRTGAFEHADSGTIFLDEIGELDLGAQARLLRVLAEHRYTRLGSSTEHRANVRIVAATNRDLDAEVAAGRFRADLYYRLSPAIITIPPLRARPRDLEHLAEVFLATAARELGAGGATLSAEAMACLQRHPWHGNVRELKDAMTYAVARAQAAGTTLIAGAHLPARILRRTPPTWPPISDGAAAPGLPAQFEPIDRELARLEELRMRQALEVTGGVQRAAAELLRMPRRTFITKMGVYKIASRRERRNRALRDDDTSGTC